MTQMNEGGLKAFTAGEALEKYRRVKFNTTDGKVYLAGANDEDIGICDIKTLINQTATIRLRNTQGTRKVACVSSGVKGATLYGAASGQVDDVPGGKAWGIALEDFATGAIVEALPKASGQGIVFVATADSAATGTSTAAEAFFPTNQYTVPGGSMKPGDVITVEGKVVVTAQNGTDTAQAQLYIGAVKIQDFGARDLDATEELAFKVKLVVQDVGAVGHVKGSGNFSAGDLITSVAAGAFSLASTAIDTTIDNLIRASVTFSSSNVGNAAKLRDLIVTIDRQ